MATTIDEVITLLEPGMNGERSHSTVWVFRNSNALKTSNFE